MISGAMLIAFIFCLPLSMGKIGPNRFYGYRTTFSLSSRENWFHMNRFAARLLLPFFAIMALADIFFSEKILVWVMLGGLALAFVICLLEEWRLKRKQRKKRGT
jgi:uncharacterized membrane protein